MLFHQLNFSNYELEYTLGVTEYECHVPTGFVQQRFIKISPCQRTHLGRVSFNEKFGNVVKSLDLNQKLFK